MSKCYSHIECVPTSDDWIPSYLDVITKLVAQHGGRYLYRTTDFESVEMPANTPTTVMVCIEWPDAAAPTALYADPDYQAHKQARWAGSETRWFNAPEHVE
jgi:uncharacterized protein (DUF1330 family)